MFRRSCAPVLAVLGAFLLQSALNKVKALERWRARVGPGAGRRPSAASAYTRWSRELDDALEESRAGSECHVCERSVSFRADVRVDTSSKWRRGATGRVYLATRADDYYPRTTRARTPRAPPLRAKTPKTRDEPQVARPPREPRLGPFPKGLRAVRVAPACDGRVIARDGRAKRSVE